MFMFEEDFSQDCLRPIVYTCGIIVLSILYRNEHMISMVQRIIFELFNSFFRFSWNMVKELYLQHFKQLSKNDPHLLHQYPSGKENFDPLLNQDESKDFKANSSQFIINEEEEENEGYSPHLSSSLNSEKERRRQKKLQDRQILDLFNLKYSTDEEEEESEEESRTVREEEKKENQRRNPFKDDDDEYFDFHQRSLFPKHYSLKSEDTEGEEEVVDVEEDDARTSFEASDDDSFRFSSTSSATADFPLPLQRKEANDGDVV